MTPGLEWLLIAWGIATGIFLILLFYRSVLTRQEGDQLFIDESASGLETEQRQLIAKVNKIGPGSEGNESPASDAHSRLV